MRAVAPIRPKVDPCAPPAAPPAMPERPGRPLPGTTKPRRFRPRFHYELLVCGLARPRARRHRRRASCAPQDAAVARERRRRALAPLPALRQLAAAGRRPSTRRAPLPPDRDEVELPLRGRALRDKVVLRLIAIDRALHFVVLGAHRGGDLRLRRQPEPAARRRLPHPHRPAGRPRRPGRDRGTACSHELRRLFSVQHGTLTKIGVVVAALRGARGRRGGRAVVRRRWAEYLTFVATDAAAAARDLRAHAQLSPLKVVTLVINVAVVVYLLRAKRLFGLRGGARAEREERERDMGWPAIERTTPGALPLAT